MIMKDQITAKQRLLHFDINVKAFRWREIKEYLKGNSISLERASTDLLRKVSTF